MKLIVKFMVFLLLIGSANARNYDDDDFDDDCIVEDLKNDEKEANDDENGGYGEEDSVNDDDDDNNNDDDDGDPYDEMIQAKRAIPSLDTTASALNTNFLAAIAKGPRAVGTPPAVDLMLILHRSVNTGQANVDLAVKFFKKLLKFFSISPSTTRVAAVSYSTYSKTEFDFNDHVNRKCVNQALGKIRVSGRKTATNGALRRANGVFKSSKKGARLDTAKSVVFLLVDEPYTGLYAPRNQAQKLRGSPVNAEIFVLGVGTSLTDAELQSIASSNSHVFRVTQFSDLEEIIIRLNPQDSYKYCTMYRPLGGITRLVDRLHIPAINPMLKIKHYDECLRRCECKNNKLVNCCRVRKEFTSMTAEERERYVNAVKTASTTEPFKTEYRRVVKRHKRQFNWGIHGQREFLPWHRLFILDYENVLRQVDCRVTVPYWDWSLWSHDPWSCHAVGSELERTTLGLRFLLFSLNKL